MSFFHHQSIFDCPGFVVSRWDGVLRGLQAVILWRGLLGVWNYWVRVWNYCVAVVNYWVAVWNYGLSVPNYRVVEGNYRLSVANYRLLAVNDGVNASHRVLKAVDCVRLVAAVCLRDLSRGPYGPRNSVCDPDFATSVENRIGAGICLWRSCGSKSPHGAQRHRFADCFPYFGRRCCRFAANGDLEIPAPGAGAVRGRVCSLSFQPTTLN